MTPREEAASLLNEAFNLGREAERAGSFKKLESVGRECDTVRARLLALIDELTAASADGQEETEMTAKTTYRLGGKIAVRTHPCLDGWETVNQCDGDLLDAMGRLMDGLPEAERTAYRYDPTFAEAVATHARVVAMIDAALLTHLTHADDGQEG